MVQLCLVGGFNPSEKSLVNWDDYSQYMETYKITCSKPPIRYGMQWDFFIENVGQGIFFTHRSSSIWDANAMGFLDRKWVYNCLMGFNGISHGLVYVFAQIHFSL